MAIKMASTVRLLGKKFWCCNGLGSLAVLQRRAITLKPKPAVPLTVVEGHDERNLKLSRPTSPHMTIYKFQLPALLSITHRFTGIILGGYAATFAAVSLLSKKPVMDIVQNISQCYPNFFLIFKVGLIFPFTYHFFNGIRHLIWDTGKLLSMKGVYVTGYLTVLLAILTTAGLIYVIEDAKRVEKENSENIQKQEEEAKAEEVAAAAAAADEAKNKKK